MSHRSPTSRMQAGDCRATRRVGCRAPAFALGCGPKRYSTAQIPGTKNAAPTFPLDSDKAAYWLGTRRPRTRPGPCAVTDWASVELALALGRRERPLEGKFAAGSGRRNAVEPGVEYEFLRMIRAAVVC